jgi:hypothetical protein
VQNIYLFKLCPRIRVIAIQELKSIYKKESLNTWRDFKMRVSSQSKHIFPAQVHRTKRVKYGFGKR